MRNSNRKTKLIGVFTILLLVAPIASSLNDTLIPGEPIVGIQKNEDGSYNITHFKNTKDQPINGEVLLSVIKTEENGSYSKPSELELIIYQHNGFIKDIIDYDRVMTVLVRVPVGSEQKFMREIIVYDIIKATILNMQLDIGPLPPFLPPSINNYDNGKLNPWIVLKMKDILDILKPTIDRLPKNLIKSNKLHFRLYSKLSLNIEMGIKEFDVQMTVDFTHELTDDEITDLEKKYGIIFDRIYYGIVHNVGTMYGVSTGEGFSTYDFITFTLDKEITYISDGTRQFYPYFNTIMQTEEGGYKPGEVLVIINNINRNDTIIIPENVTTLINELNGTLRKISSYSKEYVTLIVSVPDGKELEISDSLSKYTDIIVESRVNHKLILHTEPDSSVYLLN